MAATNRYFQSPDAWQQTEYIEIPIYSEQAEPDGSYEIIGYRKEYI